MYLLWGGGEQGAFVMCPGPIFLAIPRMTERPSHRLGVCSPFRCPCFTMWSDERIFISLSCIGITLSLYRRQLCEKKVDDSLFADMVKKQIEVLRKEREEQQKPIEPIQVGCTKGSGDSKLDIFTVMSWFSIIYPRSIIVTLILSRFATQVRGDYICHFSVQERNKRSRWNKQLCKHSVALVWKRVFVRVLWISPVPSRALFALNDPGGHLGTSMAIFPSNEPISCSKSAVSELKSVESNCSWVSLQI